MTYLGIEVTPTMVPGERVGFWWFVFPDGKAFQLHADQVRA